LKTIPLTQGQVALVDDEDFARFGHFKWCALKMKGGFYAVRRRPKPSNGIALLHREILGLTDPKTKGDHINHDTLDCQRHNLRACTHAQNQANRKGATTKSASGMRGVRRRRDCNRWSAEIEVDGRKKYLGTFKTAEEAALAYAAANLQNFGEFGGGL
jgi:hypothetical protein